MLSSGALSTRCISVFHPVLDSCAVTNGQPLFVGFRGLSSLKLLFVERDCVTFYPSKTEHLGNMFIFSLSKSNQTTGRIGGLGF